VKTFLLLLTLFIAAQAKEITMEFLNSKPKSIYKDYYIWRYLDNDIDKSQAIKLMGEVKRMNRKLFLKFAKKIDTPAYKKILKCYKMSPKEFLKADADCIKLGFSVYDATKLNKKDLQIIENKIQKPYPRLYKALKVVESNNPYKKLISSNPVTFFDVFDRIGSNYRLKYFNKILPKKVLEKISKNSRFNYAVKLIVMNPSLTNLQKSIIDINSQNLNAKANFFLALNALKHGYKKTALRYLKLAQDKYYYRFDKDKALFWQYLITKDLETLYKLTESFDINIYTIYAQQQLNGIKTDRIVSSLKCSQTKPHVDITDPFDWLDILEKLNAKDSDPEKLADSFKSCDELPYKAFALERANYKENSYFIMPYERYLKGLSVEKKALMLAIARQESRFIPSSVSTSYALGMMQFMPFLAKATAKQKKRKDFDLDDMFRPEIAYDFASSHLDYLMKHLHNPLYVAYAYNGGIGFTLRMLKSGLFKKGKYEPYLSMELVPYDESKRYAKKVLANYIVYSYLLGKRIDIKTLFQNLIEP